jgi:Uncharacterized protein conserved in bacteria C-term(DUF2220)
MKHLAWLSQLHHQWMKARARRTDPSVRAFRRDWEQLLDEADIHRAEDRQAAQREAERMPQVKVITFKKKPRFIDKIELPLESEAWLHERFGSVTGATNLAKSLEIVASFSERKSPSLSKPWQSLLELLLTSFTASRSLGPFSWMNPEPLELHLSLLWDLTAREWPHGTLIRDASTAIGRDSKMLEAHQASLVRGLEFLLGEETPLEALGIQSSNSVLNYSGPLILHLKDHSKPLDLRFQSTLTLAELSGATHISTTAKRLLTVENHKTTFRQLALADADRETLIVSTSFPSQAVRVCLDKLPVDLPHYHFGDTDPSGWDILRRLREVSPRPVMPFQMTWRPIPESSSLTPRDQQILARLLADPLMSDCHEPMQQMLTSGQRGLFEQESLGAPRLSDWPFY